MRKLTVFSALVFIFLCSCSMPWEKATEIPMGNETHFGTETESLPDAWKQPLYHDTYSGSDMAFKAEDGCFKIYNGSEFVRTYLNGVNVGSGYPGSFPGELAVPESVYFDWFEDISKMNCNTIRIYTTMMPAFYNALYEYNRVSDDKLYLIMGVWYDEDMIEASGDAFDVLEDAVAEAKEQIDIIHGKGSVEKRVGKAYGVYNCDISEYVLGWILGIESDAYFIKTTNMRNPDKTCYKGNYLYTDDEVQPFDAFLCEFGDRVVSYELQEYKMQRPLSWANWQTADELSHPGEPLYDIEDAVEMNVERFHLRESFSAGIFASYHVYPYYPEYMILQQDYVDYRDENGEIDTYEAYLKDLMSIHNIPVLIAEFGVPTSRGCTHVNPYSGYNQGALDEKQQGEALKHMAEDIHECGCAGGLVFAWQDEWFKRTWNTMDYSDAGRRPFWSDIQTSEQSFGLLAFDPGENGFIVNIDGEKDDWTEEDVIYEEEDIRLSAKHDERYLYLAVQLEKEGIAAAHLYLPIDVTPLSGSSVYGSSVFDRDVDFVIDIDGASNSHIYNHSYYDRYAFMYRYMDDRLEWKKYREEDNDIFTPIYLCLNKPFTIPTTGEERGAERYETGKLKKGISDPASEGYDPLTDFNFTGKFLEIRIPWALLNFRDPSTKTVEGDFWSNKRLGVGEKIEAIYIGCVKAGDRSVSAEYTWDDWNSVRFHERLKESYYIMQECFGELK
ncbi:MAG: family 2 glycosyl transferase [Lachnospiraceae bacterium]|nr:family 2 glycosyl transferase [Lachnospiraceae bacterium]